jgi:ferredoxin
MAGIRIEIDADLCGGHGVCEGEAPEIFRVVVEPGGYAHVALLLERPPAELHAKARLAARQCPNRVITIVEE